MNHINVFVESIADAIPPRELPLADDDEIRSALLTVQETDDLYHDEHGELRLDEDWYRAAVLDFGDWLQCHLPEHEAHMIAYKFSDLSFVRTWLEYSAEEMGEGIYEKLVEGFGIPLTSEVAQAQLTVASMLSMGNPITVSVISEHVELDRIYIPAIRSEIRPRTMNMALDFGVDEEGREIELSAQEWRDAIYFRLLTNIIIACLKSRTGTLSFVVHDAEEGMEGLGIYAFAAGHVCPIDNAQLSEVMDVVTTDPSVLMDVLADYEPETDFESYMVSLASAIAGGLQDGLQSAYEHASGRRATDDVVDPDMGVRVGLLGGAPLILTQSLTGEFAGEPGPVAEGDSEPAADIFVRAMEASPFVTPDEASAYMLSSEITRGAFEILLFGGTDEASERAVDLIQQLDLGMVDDDIDIEDIEVLEEHASYVEQMRELDASDEAYEMLPDESKSSLTHLMNLMTLDANEMHSFVTLEGDIDKPNVHVTAKCLSMPAATADVPQDVHEKLYRMLRSLMLDAMNSPNTTLFCASRVPMSSSAHISVLTVKDGTWSDVGEEKAMMYLDTTNVSEPLNIQPGDMLEYRNLLS